MRSYSIYFCLCTVLAIANSVANANDPPIQITPADGKFEVRVGDQLFCNVDYRGYEKPIVYPIYGPGQTPMTRNYPMQKDVKGEATDHPHHKSMWFGHGDVNGVSFWHEEGRTVTDEARLVESPDGSPVVELQDRLVAPNGNVVCRETMRLRFGADESSRWIDWDVTLHAGEQEVKLGDTKEGTAALRTHPNLRLSNDPRRGVTTAAGVAVNSEGVTGRAVWGKRAKWVDYSGSIDGKSVGIAFFDNPQNFRHPTYWHAREYGLFSANPFGLSNFVGSGEDGSHTIPAGGEFRLQYRIIFHEGNAEEADIEQRYQSYVEGEKT